MAGLLVLVIALAAGALVVRGLGGRETSTLERDFERLRSTDGLYTAPQIKSLAGNSLPETAYASAAMALLQLHPHLSRATVARLQPGVEDDPTWDVWYGVLLARAGAPAREPAREAVLRLWQAHAPSEPAIDASARFFALVEVSERAGIQARELSPADRRAIRRSLTRTVRERSPAVALERARLLRFLGQPPDAAVRAAAQRRAPRSGDTQQRSIEAASRIELRTILHLSVKAAEVVATGGAAADAGTPVAAYAAARAASVAGVPATALVPLRQRLLRTIGGDGAVRERAMFPGIPKAVWLIAQARRELNIDALPDKVVVRLSQAIPRTAAGDQRDPDNLAFLLAAAKLANLSYEGVRLGALPAPAQSLSSAEDAAVWSQQAAALGDLGMRQRSVDLVPWQIRTEPELAATGAMLDTARRLHISVHPPRTWIATFRRRASAHIFQTARATLQTSAGLVALGDRRAAGRLVARYIGIGCRGYRVLAAGPERECDLESTVLILRLRHAVPAAARLVERMTSTAG